MKGWPRILLLAAALVILTAWSVPVAEAGGPAGGDDVEMFPVDLSLKAIRPSAEWPCVSFIDGGGRGWYIADVDGVHRSLRRLSFKPGQRIRVLGDACRDCMEPVCGTFAGFIFNARIVPIRPGDVNGDGEVNTADIATVLANLGACPGAPDLCPGDVNYNGTVDLDDLLRVMELVGRRVHLATSSSG